VNARPTLLISDYAGHAFTHEAAVALDRQVWPTAYSYCVTTVTPKGSMATDDTLIVPVSSGARFEKYNLPRRLLSEVRYGVGVSAALWRLRPKVHVVCNMPLVSLFVIWLLSLPLRTKLVIWFQDVQSGLAAGILGDRWPARALSRLESFLLRRARRVIAISPELAAEAERRGVDRARLGILENWAPLEAIPQRPRDNDWATRQALLRTTTFVYSGTLARKHNPQLLVDLASAVQSIDGTVVVVSEGEGADWLDEQRTSHDFANLVLLPYQDFAELPDVLGAADVLLVLLEPLAGPFSVPSKTLSYLCAGRPIIGAMPLTNTASVTIAERAHAGIVVGPDDSEGFCAAAKALAADPTRRHTLGASGRTYAEEHFAQATILERLAGELRKVSPGVLT
jgi:colanic acid biosynthesis glycosyl transferase WcaI